MRCCFLFCSFFLNFSFFLSLDDDFFFVLTKTKNSKKKKKKNFETIYILTAESMSAASCALVLVGCGVESGLSTSHITSTSCPPRMGSG